MQHVKVNGVELAYLAQGEGPLVLLLHGFPDTAHTWDAVRPALAAAGYRAVSPFLRGYHPSGLAPDGRYDAEALGRDVLGLVEALGERSAILVGHDFGALASFAAVGLDPTRVQLLVTVAIPHPAGITPTPRLMWSARHIVRFKLPGAVAALRADDFALVDTLVRRWSPAWDVPAGVTDAVKRGFAHPGRAEAAIAYYRALPISLPPFLRARVPVPSVAFAGETDTGLTIDIYERARSLYASEYEVIRMPGGHFLHLEDPERFRDELVGLLRRKAP